MTELTFGRKRGQRAGSRVWYRARRDAAIELANDAAKASGLKPRQAPGLALLFLGFADKWVGERGDGGR